MTLSDRKQHYLGLDGLRGVAALAVASLHGAEQFSASYVPRSASLAVDFFFILSGFVIAHAYDDAVLTNVMSFKEFMMIRIIRLYPMIFVGTILGASVFLIGEFAKHQVLSVSTNIIIGIGSFFLFPVGLVLGNLSLEAYPLNNPVWSLFFEFVANAVYATRLGGIANRKLAWLVAVFAVVFVTALILSNIQFNLIGFGGWLGFSLGIFRVVFSFFLGVLIFRGHAISWIPKISILKIAAFLAVILSFPFTDNIFSLACVMLVFPITVLCAAAACVEGYVASFCAKLGALSYPLYLLHQPIFRILNNVARILHIDLPPLLGCVAGVAVSVVVAQLCLAVFDTPIRNRLRRRWVSRSSETVRRAAA